MRKSRKKRNVQVERRIFHGDFLDVHIFPRFPKARGSRAKARHTTSEVQKKLNQKYREEKVKYLIDTNFSEKDLEIGLSFDDKYLPETYADCQRAVRNFIRRLKTFRKKHGLSELKYLYVIERGERNGRFHVHMIVNSFSETKKTEGGGTVTTDNRTEIEKIWGLGSARSFTLDFSEEGLKGLAKYKVKEPETAAAEIPEKVRRWAASKNLKKPYIPEDRKNYISKSTCREIREGYITERELERLYPGYVISEVEPLFNDCNGGEYLTLRLRRLKSEWGFPEVVGGRLDFPRNGFNNDGEVREE